MTAREIDRVRMEELTQSTFESVYEGQRPFVIVDGASSWMAVQKWRPDYLRSILGNKRVKVMHNTTGIFDYNAVGARAVDPKDMSFDAANRLITSAEGHQYYIQQQNVILQFKELVPDLGIPYLLGKRRITSVNFWYGGRGCKTQLHFDYGSNFLVQILGDKKLMLYPPSESASVYPASGDARMKHMSLVDVFEPDLETFPLYARAEPELHRVTLEPGDILYIPLLWWHAVKCSDVAISVNFWHVAEGLVASDGPTSRDASA